MRRVHPASAAVAGVAIAAVLLAGNAFAADGPRSGGAITDPTQQQALAANETVRNYILDHPDVPLPTPTGTATPTPTTTATPTPSSTATPTPTEPTPTVTSSPSGQYASGLPWSDGGFFEHSATRASEFAAWRGAPVDNIETYTSRANWRVQLNDWWADSVPPSFRAERDDFILSVPLWTDDGSRGSDQNWKDLAAKTAAVDPDALVRLGWEMNCCFSQATNARAWTSQFSRAVTLMRSVAPGLQIVFNPIEGHAQNGTAKAVESLYVAGKVDIIALDAYDWYEPWNTEARINYHLNRPYGWEYWYEFARDRGLPFALGEFSVYSASSASGGDNPRFFETVYGWLLEKHRSDPGSIRFVSLFNSSEAYCGCAISDTANPKAAARYKALIAQIRNK